MEIGVEIINRLAPPVRAHALWYSPGGGGGITLWDRACRGINPQLILVKDGWGARLVRVGPPVWGRVFYTTM